jgi:hypothetical protein
MNYGSPGAGPLEALYFLKHQKFLESTGGVPDLAIYTYIPDHARRVMMSMQNIERYNRYATYKDGSLDHLQPIYSPRFFSWWKLQMLTILDMSQTLKFFGINVPLTVDDESVLLSAQYLNELKKEWKAKTNNDNFLVFVWPNMENSGVFKKSLEELEIPYLDYAELNLVEYANPSMVNAYEHHPSVQVHQFFSDRIIQDLALEKKGPFKLMDLPK